MSGKILIVDAVATNRIILKVKLCAAHFEVYQAPSAREAMVMLPHLQPDMIIANVDMPDMSSADFLGALRARADLAAIPVVLLLSGDQPEARVAALKAGADDVITRPIDERAMLARLRSLLRQHHNLQDMRLNAGADCQVGFAEAKDTFAHAGRIAVMGSSMADAMGLRTRLRAACRHMVAAYDFGHFVGNTLVEPVPDVFVLMMPEGAPEHALRLMAELRAIPKARHSRILAICPPGESALVATLLDMGASDVMQGPADMTELALRLNNQLQRKVILDRLRDRLHDGLRAAMLDPLTGLYNRRFALPFLRDLATTRAGQPQRFAVMVADLDHFKQINDHLGHAAGDAVLRHVADLLKSNMRSRDMVARIGGEEFLIVMPDTTRAKARETADRLCRLVSEAEIPLRKDLPPARVTISIGVTLAQSRESADDSSVEALLDQADSALYGAKADGRNTVTVNARPAA